MADELNKSAEFTGKHQDEESPILVAQRYLNIYRQIHIFNKKRQDQFDDSLLQMSPDIRILLSTLPGGSLLLEHIAELEEKRGIIPDALLDSQIAENKEAAKNEKVLSSSKTNGKNSDNTALPNNLIKVLQQNEEKHAKDIQALTNAFLKSQESMTAILQQALNIKTAEDTIKPENTQKTSSKVEEKAPQKVEEKTSVKETKEVPETKEQNEPNEETAKPETTSKILSFTKKLFSGHKNENEEDDKQDISPLIDTTPVSLDEIDSAPISLDTPDGTPVLLDVKEPETPSDDSSDDKESNDDWEWEYVDEDENGTSDDDEWEYVEEEESAPSDDDEWEYVEEEDENTPTPVQENQTEYTEETPEVLSDNQQFDTVEGNESFLPADDEQWQYTEDDPNALQNDEQWTYTEDPNADYAYQDPNADYAYQDPNADYTYQDPLTDDGQWEYTEDPLSTLTNEDFNDLPQPESQEDNA